MSIICQKSLILQRARASVGPVLLHWFAAVAVDEGYKSSLSLVERSSLRLSSCKAK